MLGLLKRDFGEAPAAPKAAGLLAAIIRPAVRPVAEIVALQPEERLRVRSYEEVARSIGFMPTQLLLVKMYEFMSDAGIEVFDNRKVDAYLRAMTPRGSAWCWRPLRPRDRIEDFQFGGARGFYSASNWACRPYESLAPRHALEKVERIDRQFGASVKFFVSDFGVPNADPFIMCRPGQCDSGDGDRPYEIIFDVWDEPGFGK